MNLITTISLKRPVKDKIDILRGDVPVSRYITRLIEREWEKENKDVCKTGN